jgi:hypothetical protein
MLEVKVQPLCEFGVGDTTPLELYCGAAISQPFHIDAKHKQAQHRAATCLMGRCYNGSSLATLGSKVWCDSVVHIALQSLPSCAEYARQGHTRHGVYWVQDREARAVPVVCHMQADAGWMVIQR